MLAQVIEPLLSLFDDGSCPAGIHHSTSCGNSEASKNSRRRRKMSACALRYVHSNIDSMDSQTLKLIKISGSPRTRTDVELPSAVWWRQTNPGLASPSRLIGSKTATKSAMRRSSNGAISRAMLYCATW